jgi:hypothetical protein
LLPDAERDRPQGLGHRRNRGQYVDAIRVVVDHALQATHLAFDAAEPLLDLGLLLFVAPHVTIPL